jgi:hypothetical protein
MATITLATAAVLAAYLTGTATGPRRPEEAAAAAVFLLIVASGLLYASRLGADRLGQ